MKQAISIQLILFLEIKLQNEIFWKNITFFQQEMRPFCAPIMIKLYLRIPQYKN